MQMYGENVHDVLSGFMHSADSLIGSLRWRHNDLAPHEPRMPPHEYALKQWFSGEQLRAFDLLSFLIRNHPESFDAYFRAYRYPTRYLVLGELRYWFSALGSKFFLNRARVDSTEPVRRVDEGATRIELEQWGAQQAYWPEGSGYGEWKREDGQWVFYPAPAPEKAQKPLF